MICVLGLFGLGFHDGEREGGGVVRRASTAYLWQHDEVARTEVYDLLAKGLPDRSLAGKNDDEDEFELKQLLRDVDEVGLCEDELRVWIGTKLG